MPDLLNRKRPNGHLNIESRRIEAFKPNPKNARTHSRSQIKAIAQSIGQFGFLNPILIDDNGMILAGHGRLEAAKLLGFSEVPSVRIGELNEAQKRAYVLADNKLAERAGWDRELLAFELGELSVMLPEIGLSIELTGFEIGEIEAVKPKARKTRAAATVAVEDEVKPPNIPVTRPGDIWTLGRNRIVCGDPRRREIFAALLGDERADLVFTDLPSNTPAEGRPGGVGPAQAPDIPANLGGHSEAAFRAFLREVLGHAASVSRDRALHYLSTPWWYVADLIDAGKLVYGAPRGMCAWVDNKVDQRCHRHIKHDLAVIFEVSNGKPIGQFGLEPALPDAVAVDDLRPLSSRATSKPIGAVAEALKEISDCDALILDPHGRSGTTLLAAERAGRCARLIESDPRCVDLTVLRYEALTGDEAIHAETGATFAAVTRARKENSAAGGRETCND